MPFLTLVPVRKHMLSAHGGAEAESHSRGAGCSQGGAHWGAGPAAWGPPDSWGPPWTEEAQSIAPSSAAAPP